MIIFTSLFFLSCQTTIDLSEGGDINPCDDQRYQVLKQIDVSKMTVDEVEYYKAKDRECKSYLRADKKQATTNLIIIL